MFWVSISRTIFRIEEKLPGDQLPGYQGGGLRVVDFYTAMRFIIAHFFGGKKLLKIRIRNGTDSYGRKNQYRFW